MTVLHNNNYIHHHTPYIPYLLFKFLGLLTNFWDIQKLWLNFIIYNITMFWGWENREHIIFFVFSSKQN